MCSKFICKAIVWVIKLIIFYPNLNISENLTSKIILEFRRISVHNESIFNFILFYYSSYYYLQFVFHIQLCSYFFWNEILNVWMNKVLLPWRKNQGRDLAGNYDSFSVYKAQHTRYVSHSLFRSFLFYVACKHLTFDKKEGHWILLSTAFILKHCWLGDILTNPL